MTPSQQFADWQLLRTIQLQGVATWMLRDSIKTLEQLERDALGALLDTGVSGEVATGQRRRFNRFRSELDELITDAYRELLRRRTEDFETIVTKEDEAQREQMAALFGWQVDASQVAAASVLIIGQTLKGWLGKQAGDLQFRIEQQVQAGMTAGDNETKMRRRIKGWPGGGQEPEAVAIPSARIPSQRDLEKVLRTGVQSAADEVLKELGESLPKSIRVGWQQLSVLDNRTCLPKGELVLTQDGYSPIESIRVGDIVIGGSLKPRVVLGTKTTRTTKIATITLDDGLKIRCTPDHLFRVNGEWIEAQNLAGLKIDKQL